MKRFGFIALAAIAMLLFAQDADAQCAMCKAVVESNADAANDVGFGSAANVSGGINNGILYMMGTVYLLLMGVAWMFFKDQIREKIRSVRS